MHVRGAGLIGAAAGYGMYLATLEASRAPDYNHKIQEAAIMLRATRPTAVNLDWAIERQLKVIAEQEHPGDKIARALSTAIAIADEDTEMCKKIGL